MKPDIGSVIACSGRPYDKMDHLACFAPAMLALGATYGAVTGAKADQYMQLARNLTETCYQMYARQPTGAALAAVHVRPGICTSAVRSALGPGPTEPRKMMDRGTYLCSADACLPVPCLALRFADCTPCHCGRPGAGAGDV